MWEYLSISRENYNDDLRVVHTYCPMEISSLFPTSTSVVLDNRQSRVRKRIAESLSCLLCKGRAVKRIMCLHEIAAKIFFGGEDLSHGNIQIDRVDNANSFGMVLWLAENRIRWIERTARFILRVVEIYVIKYHLHLGKSVTFLYACKKNSRY